jgi:hypothetical protein
MKRFWLILATFLGLATTTAPAFAALQATYTLNCSTVACGTSGNYGSVTLTQVGSGSTAYVTVKVDLTTATNTTTFAGTGSGYAIAWNLVGSSPTSINITSANAANFTIQGFNTTASGYKRYKATPFTGGSCGATTASCFMYAIDYNIGGSGGSDKILVFDVKRTGGLSISDFNLGNSLGFFFASDVSGPCSPTCNVASNTKVPEPGTLTMSIAGLMGLVGFAVLQRRRKQVGA